MLFIHITYALCFICGRVLIGNRKILAVNRVIVGAITAVFPITDHLFMRGQNMIIIAQRIGQAAECTAIITVHHEHFNYQRQERDGNT